MGRIVRAKEPHSEQDFPGFGMADGDRPDSELEAPEHHRCAFVARLFPRP